MATPSAATLGYGSELRVKVSGTFLRVAEVHDADGPNEEVNDVEVTNLDSADSRREFIGGLIDPAALTFECNFTKAEYIRMRSFLRVKTDWEYQMTDGTIQAFSGYVKNTGTKMVVDDKITMPIGVKITGPITVT